MLRSTTSKVMWVGRATVFLVGLAVILALVVGVASTAFAGNGDAWKLGRSNVATAITALGGKLGVDGPILRLTNNNAGTNDTALDLRVQAGETPMRVNSPTKVANLNADQLDGKDFSAFGAKSLLRSFGGLPLERTFTSEGGTLVISASGSGFRGTGFSQKEGFIGMRVLVDGISYHSSFVYTNERNSHKAFVPTTLVVRNLPAGTHTLRLEAIKYSVCNTANETPRDFCTGTDVNDIFDVSFMEIPA